MRVSPMAALLLALAMPEMAAGQETDIAEDEKWYLLGETLFAYAARTAPRRLPRQPHRPPPG